MAVGYNRTGAVAERWNGTKWTLERVPARTLQILSSVACVKASVCMAVGEISPLAVKWNGRQWTRERVPGSWGSPPSSVACPKARDCVAVGGGAMKWNGRKWLLERLPVPKAAEPNSRLARSVSCARATSCVAVGSFENSSFALTALAERWNGTKWAVMPAPATAPSWLSSVSCKGADCQAICCGEVGGGHLAEGWNGTTWTSEPVPLGTLGAIDLFAVSCSSASNCMAVGQGDTITTAPPVAERWNGTTWTLESVPVPRGDTTGGRLSGVSCTSATRCVAVGFAYTSPSETYAPMAARWNGTKWTLLPMPRS